MRSKVDRFVLGLMMVLCILSLVFVVVRAEAATDTDMVKMVSYTAKEVSGLNGEAPKEEGFLFGGWYKDKDDETSYLKSIEDVTGTIYAKFVPEQVLSVKAQLSASNREKYDGKANLRFVTTVDSLKYEEVGFKVSWTKDGESKETEIHNSKVYQTLSAMEDGEQKKYNAKLFSEASEYFKACTVVGISYDFYGVEFTVTPFWVTMDGTRVDGITAVKTVNDGRTNLDEVYVASDGSDKGLGTVGAPFATFAYAMSSVKNGGKIYLLDDMELQTTVTVKTGFTVTVQSATDKSTTIYRGTGLASKSMFDIASGGELTVKDITIDGRTKENAAITINESDYNSLKDYIDAATKGSVSSQFLISNKGTVNFDGATVQYVKRNGNGAVVMCLAGTATTVTASNGTTFKYNEGGTGGVIYTNDGASVDLQNTTFAKNCATSIAGTIFITGSSSVLRITEHCTFTGNVAANGNGGAIRIAGGPKVEVKNSTFESNTSSARGGAIHTSTNIAVEKTDFKENSAKTDGGAICLADSSTLKITDCTFELNTAATGNGGAVYAPGNIDAEQCGFTDNSANSDGGAIYIAVGSDVTIKKSEFESNTSMAGSGGAISAQTDMAIDSCKFTGNTAKPATNVNTGGGAIYITDGSSIIIKNSEFQSNETTNGYGGAILTQKDMTVDNSSFISNKASIMGGAFYSQKGAVLTLKTESGTDKAICQGNEAGIGGAIGIGTGTLNVTGYTFDGNSTKNATGGGAVALNNEAIEANLTECVFVRNRAQKAGAILAQSNNPTTKPSVVTVTNCSFGGTDEEGESLGNVAADNPDWGNKCGGAIWADAGVTINLVGTDTAKAYFEKNTSNVNGGAIYFKGTLTGSGYRFTENEPNDIYNDGGTNEYKGEIQLSIGLNSQFYSTFGLDYKAQLDIIKKTGFDSFFLAGRNQLT